MKVENQVIVQAPGESSAAGILPSPSAAGFCWRIRFVRAASPGAQVVREFADPQQTFAVLENLPPAELPGSDSADSFVMVGIPSGGKDSDNRQRAAQEWFRAPATQASTGRIIEIPAGRGKILFRPGRALFLGNFKRFDHLLAGMLEFAWYESQLRKLESELDADWSELEKNSRLTHAVGKNDLPMQPVVNAMTRTTTERRMRYTRLERWLEEPSAALPKMGQRLVERLIEECETEARLGTLDGCLEVFEDVYELCNDRLTEFRYFSSEYWLEIYIIVILLAELLVMMVDFFLLRREG